MYIMKHIVSYEKSLEIILIEKRISLERKKLLVTTSPLFSGYMHRTKSCIVKDLRIKRSDHCIMYLCIMYFNTYIIQATNFHARLITFESI